MAEMVLVAVLGFLAGQFLPRNWAAKIVEWRDRVEGHFPAVEEMSVEDLVSRIFSRTDREEVLRRIADEAKRMAEEVRARAEEQRKK